MHHPKIIQGNVVTIEDGNFEKAIRKFKKKVALSGVLNDLREHEFYEKPTTKKKRKKNLAVRRWKKKLEMEKLPKKQY